MPYPPRPQLQPLSELAGTAAAGRFLDRDLRLLLEAYIVTAYQQGRLLREIVELVDRTPTAVLSVLDAHQVPRRATGAARTGARRRPNAANRARSRTGLRWWARRRGRGPGGLPVG